MPLLTVFTPTFNRSSLLSRAYQSLLDQREQNFDWLIIDDGSEDGTEEVVRQWISKGIIPIHYVRKPNGGKYTAMLEAREHIRGDWVIILDSDDELTPDATRVLAEEISRIRESALPIREIRAFCKLADGKTLDHFIFPGNTEVFDATWHEAVLRHGMDTEMLSCLGRETYLDVVHLPDNLWLKEKFRYFSEAVFWARIKTKTRYLNKELRIYHLDAYNSVMRNTSKETGYYDDIIFSRYFLSENTEQFFKRPSYFISLCIKYIVAGRINHVRMSTLFTQASGWRFKLLFLLMFIPSQLYYGYGKNIRGAFWR